MSRATNGDRKLKSRQGQFPVNPLAKLLAGLKKERHETVFDGSH